MYSLPGEQEREINFSLSKNAHFIYRCLQNIEVFGKQLTPWMLFFMQGLIQVSDYPLWWRVTVCFFFIIFRVVQSEVHMKRHDCPPISVKKWAVHYHRQTTAQPGQPGQDGQPGAR